MLFLECTPSFAAERELASANAAGYGAALANSKPDARAALDRYVRDLRRLAFPAEPGRATSPTYGAERMSRAELVKQLGGTNTPGTDSEDR